MGNRRAIQKYWYGCYGPVGRKLPYRRPGDTPIPASLAGTWVVRTIGTLPQEGTDSVVRRALAMATSEQYLRLAINFASLAAISRLLTPTEIGISVIGTGIMTVVLGAREFATSDFLIQRMKVVHDDVRASFTVLISDDCDGAYGVCPRAIDRGLLWRGRTGAVSSDLRRGRTYRGVLFADPRIDAP